jgi:hypothetical protein
MNSTHFLKIDREPLEMIVRGWKTCEFRRDDRNPKFQVGDRLRLMEFISGKGFTQRYQEVLVTHIQRGYGIPDEFVMLSFQRLDCDFPFPQVHL